MSTAGSNDGHVYWGIICCKVQSPFGSLEVYLFNASCITHDVHMFRVDETSPRQLGRPVSIEMVLTKFGSKADIAKSMSHLLSPNLPEMRSKEYHL